MGNYQKPGRDTLYESILKKIMQADSKLPSLDQVEFTQEESERIEKLSFLDDLARKKLPVLKRADIYKLFSIKYPETSQRQFYRYWDEMQQLFGTTGMKSKDYQRSVYIEYLEQIIGLAFKTRDLKTAVGAIKEASLLQDLYSREDESKAKKEPTTFLIALNVNLPNGDRNSRIINLDGLEKLNKKEYGNVLDQINSLEYSVEQMEQQLNKSDD